MAGKFEFILLPAPPFSVEDCNDCCEGTLGSRGTLSSGSDAICKYVSKCQFSVVNDIAKVQNKDKNNKEGGNGAVN